MNPCPCGYLGHPSGRCRCTEEQVLRYRQRISGPLLDRIDLHVEVPPVKFREISGDRTGETSADIRERVVAARQRQQARFAHKPRITCNARMGAKELKEFCPLDDATKQKLQQFLRLLAISSYGEIITIAAGLNKNNPQQTLLDMLLLLEDSLKTNPNPKRLRSVRATQTAITDLRANVNALLTLEHYLVELKGLML
jgi:predicted ATPase with chaperone activity